MVEKKFFSVVFVVAAICLFARPAHAYLDPSTGSLIFQIIAAAFLGVAVFIRIYWAKVKSFFRKGEQDD